MRVIEKVGFSRESEIWEVKREESEGGAGQVDVDCCVEDLESVNLPSLGDLSPKALNYIQQLESELSSAKKELDARKQENMQMEYIRESNNDLLEYLRSLESDMVTELSRPSSLEVEEIIHQLVQNTLRKFFKDESSVDFMGDLALRSAENLQNGDDECFDAIGTSRDYLAKLLFWCHGYRLLRLSLLAFNALAIQGLSTVSGGSKSMFAKRENKTLPVMVAVVEQLGGALGESGLLVLPCVAAHLNQIVMDSFLINFWVRKEQSAKSDADKLHRRLVRLKSTNRTRERLRRDGFLGLFVHKVTWITGSLLFVMMGTALLMAISLTEGHILIKELLMERAVFKVCMT
ncbi:hypothetical protein LOK49_LG14G01172 [Camellia lanceoleosa]|uniref:Uncharacterized protein n=1 Tax=Camellia lanceoleosa TaxID=1840588 RepID=A0ACC0FAN1_9ERIC|nr:hypothetical protein LOK49_LG14G01172 [Camellia lanceoleosa]